MKLLAVLAALCIVVALLARRRPEVYAIPRWAWADDWDDPMPWVGPWPPVTMSPN